MNKLSSIIQRVLAPTPIFFKKLRTAGAILAGVSSAILLSKGTMPLIIKQIAGYMDVAAGMLIAVSQMAVEDNAKHIEDIYE